MNNLRRVKKYRSLLLSFVKNDIYSEFFPGIMDFGGKEGDSVYINFAIGRLPTFNDVSKKTCSNRANFLMYIILL